MKQVLYGAMLVLLMIGCNFNEKDNKAPSETMENNNPSLKPPLRTLKEKDISVGIYNFKHFEPLLHQKNDTVYVINFWATWCKPCVKELPGIEKIQQEYSDKKVKVILTSLDFSDKIESQLFPFITKMKLQSQVLVLDEPDANSWIPKIDATWSGAIPATLIYKNDKRLFYNHPLTYEELKKEINKLIITKN